MRRYLCKLGVAVAVGVGEGEGEGESGPSLFSILRVAQSLGIVKRHGERLCILTAIVDHGFEMIARDR